MRRTEDLAIVVIGLVVVLGVVVTAYVQGQRSAKDHYDAGAWKSAAEASELALRGVISSAKTTQAIAEASAARTAEIRTFTTTLIREVPSHVSPETDARFPLPVGLVRLHDAAAAGLELSAVPDPAGRADGEASSIAPSQFAAVVATNYGTCREDQSRLSAWQAWATAQASAP